MTVLAEDVADALSAYGRRLLGAPEPVEHSVRNENYRVPTDQGPLFLRFHRRSRSIERLRREHRAIHWAAERGLPVVPPLVARAGDTLVEVNGRIVAAFPWVAGTSPRRGQIAPAQVEAMGAMQGRLHAVLADYPDPDLPWFWGAWDANPGRSAELLRGYAEELSSAQLPADEHELILACLSLHLERLEAEGEAPPPSPQTAGAQPVHGDYHERNVLLDDHDRIAAVVDWDMVTRMPRAFELVRCLSYAELLAPLLLEPYLRAYRQHTRLAPVECVEAVDTWWRYNLRDTWLYRTRLRERDAAVQPFFAQQLELLTRFGDPAYRAHLAAELRRLAGAEAQTGMHSAP